MENMSLLSFDIYNDAGKNELYVGAGSDFTQTLRIRIANNKPSNQIILTETGGYHFSLILKKGLLPPDFNQNNIKVSRWRQIKGEDILDIDKLKSLPAFDIKGIKTNNSLELNIEKVTTALDKIIKSAEKPITEEAAAIALSNDTATPVSETPAVTENQTVFPLKMIADYLKNAGEDVKSGFDTLLELLKVVEEKDFREEHKWVNELGSIRDLYVKSLTDLQVITQEEGVLSQNALLAEGFEKMSAVFKDFAELHKRTIRILSELELLDLKLRKKSAEITQDAYSLVKQQLVTDLKPFLENFFQVDQILKPLSEIKLDEFFNLDQVSLNETLMQQLERKLVVEDTKVKGEWVMSRANVSNNEEEEELKFLYKPAKKNQTTSKSNNKIEINPYGYVLIDIEIEGNLVGKSESLNVQLDYPKTKFFKNGKAIKTGKDQFFSQSVINLLNYGDTGLPIPLRPDVIQGRELLNNGEYANQSTVQLTNIGREPIFLNKNSRLEVRFEVQNEAEVKYSALMEKENTSVLNIGLITLDAVTMDAKLSKDFQLKPDAAETDIVTKYYELDENRTKPALVEGFSFATLNEDKIKNPYDGVYYGKIFVFRKRKADLYEVYEINNVITNASDMKVTQRPVFLKLITFTNDTAKTEKSANYILKSKQEPIEALRSRFCPSYNELDLDGIVIPKVRKKTHRTFVGYAHSTIVNTYKDALASKEVKGLSDTYKVFKCDIKSINFYEEEEKKPKFIVGSAPDFIEAIRIRKTVSEDNKILHANVAQLSTAQDITTNLKHQKGTVNANYTADISKKLRLPPGKSLVVKIRNLMTKMPTGTARLEIALLNVPKFRDTVFSAEFERVAYFTTLHSGIFSTGTLSENILVAGQNEAQISAGDLNMNLNQQNGVSFFKGQKNFLNITNVGDGARLKNGEHSATINNEEGFSLKNREKEIFQVNQEKLSLRNKEKKEVLKIDGQTAEIKVGDFQLNIDAKEGFTFKKKNEKVLNINEPDDILKQIMPIGSVIMWHGDANNLPAGWSLCDGYNGTPDLRNRFPLGAGGSIYPYKGGGYKEEGGTFNIELKEEHLPAHRHSVSGNTEKDGEHQEWWRGWYRVASGSIRFGGSGVYDKNKRNVRSKDRIKGDGWSRVNDENPDHEHNNKHRHSINLTSGNTGGGQTYRHIPPYFALWYIMKTS